MGEAQYTLLKSSSRIQQSIPEMSAVVITRLDRSMCTLLLLWIGQGLEPQRSSRCLCGINPCEAKRTMGIITGELFSSLTQEVVKGT